MSQPNRVWWNNDGEFTFAQVPDELGNSGTYSVVLGDVDGDGDLDLVAGNEGPNLVWRNDDGIFTDSNQPLGNNSTQSVALEDVDGDRDLDLVAGNGGGDETYRANRVYRNDDGRFGFILDEVGASNTSSVVLGDIDGDGDSDLISGNFEAFNQVWLNDGSGKFRDNDPLDDTDTDWRTVSLALGDIDGDGDDDLIVGNSKGQDSVWRNNEGVFNRVQQFGYRSTTDVVLADVDDDGDPDLITANSPKEPNRVWLNNINNMPGEQGVFTDSGQLLGNSDTQSVKLEDVDGDSDLDLITANIFGQNRIWLSSGRTPQAALFVDSLQVLGISATRSVALGDIDGDGALDLIAGNSGVSEFEQQDRVWRNDDGGYTEVQQLSETDTQSVALGDIDGDGDLDLVSGHDGPNRIWRNDDGNFTEVLPPLGDSNTQSVALGDIDGDDHLDLVTGNDGPNRIWLNDGLGNFTVVEPPLGDSNTRSVALRDIDGDDDLDLISGNAEGQPNRVWLNNVYNSPERKGVFTEAELGLGGSSTWSLAVGDVDSDGDPDFVAGNNDGANQVWLNDY